MRQNSFNVVGLAVALLCVVVCVTIAVAVSSMDTRTPARRMQNSTQLRGIHQGLVIYAQNNEKWFPGISKIGEDDRINIEQRFQILIEEDYITPEYAISPSETEPITEWDGWDSPDEGKPPVTAGHYSYAMLQVPKEGGRRAEWRETLNSQAIVASDRNTGTKASPSSIHSDRGGRWRGSVLWNDNHVGFENSDAFETQYADGELNEADRLFEPEGTYDALLIHAGN